MSEESSNMSNDQSQPEASYDIVPMVPATSDNTVIEYIVIPIALVVLIGLAVFLVKKLRNSNATPPEQDGEEKPLNEDVEAAPAAETPAEEVKSEEAATEEKKEDESPAKEDA